MKIAITKIGANITFNATTKSAACADILYALRTIGTKENEITVITKKTRNTVIPKIIKFQEITETKDFNSFDCVLVFNGAVNFYGGAEDTNITSLYKALSNTHKRIFYVQTDGAMYFQELWPLIHKRDWVKKYKESDFTIDPDQVIYLTQSRNLEKMHQHILTKKNAIYPCELISYPWERTILMKHKKHFTQPIVPINDREFDVGYGGAHRNKYKLDKIKKYYDTSMYSALLFGSLGEKNFRYTQVRPRISYRSMVRAMGRCKATVVFGDKLYNNNFHTLRIYEAALAGTCVMVDKEFDPYNVIYRGKLDFLLVSSTTDVSNIINSQYLPEAAALSRECLLDNWDDQKESEFINELLRRNL